MHASELKRLIENVPRAVHNIQFGVRTCVIDKRCTAMGTPPTATGLPALLFARG